MTTRQMMVETLRELGRTEAEIEKQMVDVDRKLPWAYAASNMEMPDAVLAELKREFLNELATGRSEVLAVAKERMKAKIAHDAKNN